MTDDEIVQAQDRVERAYRVWHGADEDWPARMMAQDYFIDGGKLLAEVERLRAENAALREIVAFVAGEPYCAPWPTDATGTIALMNRMQDKARALLAS